MSPFRHKRRVRIHLTAANESVEGIQVGRRPVGGHYLLMVPKVLEDAGQTVTLTGTLEVPASNVLYIQVDP